MESRKSELWCRMLGRNKDGSKNSTVVDRIPRLSEKEPLLKLRKSFDFSKWSSMGIKLNNIFYFGGILTVLVTFLSSGLSADNRNQQVTANSMAKWLLGVKSTYNGSFKFYRRRKETKGYRIR